MIYSRIAGTGSYLPKKILSNAELEKMVDTTDEWIFSRTGIRERHIVADDEFTSDLALHASRQAIASANIDAHSIDLIIVATTTPDKVFPSTAVMLQNKLGIAGCPAFDMQAVCSGFTQYAYTFIAFEAEKLEGSDYKRAELLRERASKMYARAFNHGMKALDLKLTLNPILIILKIGFTTSDNLDFSKELK